ncbi:RHS repeat-associated core domain-containing protein [Shewanella maritima]|uniref:RHS repeat-associated core domain-containing protein n=1 Tax=Shewanella maritima TaxID=2520507 RepID=UPI00373606AB
MITFKGCLSALTLLVVTLTAHSSPSDGISKRYSTGGRILGEISQDPIDSRISATRYHYNDNGHLETSESGTLLSWQGNEVSPVDWPNFHIISKTHYQYNDFGMKSSTLLADSEDEIQSRTDFSYDEKFRLLCQTVRMNKATMASMNLDACTLGNQGNFGPDRITKYEYNDTGKILNIVKAYHTPIEQTYKSTLYYDNGLVKSVTDASGNKTEYTYYDDAQLHYIYFPSKTSVGQHNVNDFEEYTYNNNGLQESNRLRNGAIINNTYDSMGRISVKSVTGLRNKKYKYYNSGLLKSIYFNNNLNTQIHYEYDVLGNVTEEYNANLNKRITLDYDYRGFQQSITYPDNVTFQTIHKADGNLDSVTRSNQQVNIIKNTYDEHGILQNISSLLGMGVEFDFDDFGRTTLLSMSNLNNSVENETIIDYTPSSQIETLSKSNSGYQYDSSTDTGHDYQVNGLNQYTSVSGTDFEYSDNGNLTYDGHYTYTYDNENKLITIAGNGDNVSISYDPLGRLDNWRSNDITTKFLYLGDTLLVAYNGQDSINHRYLLSPQSKQPLVRYDGSGFDSGYRLHFDHLGSLVALSNIFGYTGKTNYSAYGVADNENNNLYGFTGQLAIPNTGLYHYKARIYHPKLGRFLQTDPVGYEDQMNLYAYVHNDPINLTDPTGESSYNPQGMVQSLGGQKGIRQASQTAGKIASASTLKVGFGAGLQVKAQNMPGVGSFDAGGSLAVSSVMTSDPSAQGIEFSADAGLNASNASGTMSGQLQLAKAEALVQPQNGTVSGKIEGAKVTGTLSLNPTSVNNEGKVKVGAHVGLIKVELEVDTKTLN